MAAKIAHAAGKRKEAIARATARPGKGIVKVNSIPLDIYSNEFARLRISEPIMVAGQMAAEVDVDVSVNGGGWSAQAEASRLAIAKALIAFTGSEQLKRTFLDYDRFLLVADTRRKEPRKFGTHSRARAKRQTSYR
ncbi:MAG TPA: 30S ribosomal protein S9 [Candidatus Nanoarchaeia archaeon]|nr:30S ribosomal protein S9 [Candidatus Nanoarchaeia archaeon]